MEPALTLGSDEIDGIKEAANVGAGRAAATLSLLIRRKCDISLPGITFADAQGVQEHFNAPDTAAVALNVRVFGDIPATMFVVTKKDCAQVIINHMTRVPELATPQGISLTTQLALKQLGAELSRAFIQSLGEFLRIKTTYDVPQLIVESWSGAFDATLKTVARPGERQLLVHCDFFDAGRTFEGKMIYILGEQSQGMLAERVKRLLSGD